MSFAVILLNSRPSDLLLLTRITASARDPKQGCAGQGAHVGLGAVPILNRSVSEWANLNGV